MNTFKRASIAFGFVVAFAASAQTPSPVPSGDPAAAKKEKLCQANPEKCARDTETLRMRKAMKEACEKNPEACKERHEHAMKRREAPQPKPPAVTK